ncbi:MAG: ribosome maturation factor RimP [Candidatus Omnitrophica bacterium]|nr:ribosome maturation factor RimP [Candidatus Omnitrophota bacterium]
MSPEITEKVKEVAAGYIKEHGIEIIDITYRRQHGGMTLRILADRPEGISVKDCEEFNKYLSEELDREDVIQDRYILEVSSPGLDRPIKTDRDFERAMGRNLEITTFEAIDGRKTHEGRFAGMDKENIVIERDGVSAVIPKNKIALARLKIEF